MRSSIFYSSEKENIIETTPVFLDPETEIALERNQIFGVITIFLPIPHYKKEKLEMSFNLCKKLIADFYDATLVKTFLGDELEITTSVNGITSSSIFAGQDYLKITIIGVDRTDVLKTYKQISEGFYDDLIDKTKDDEYHIMLKILKYKMKDVNTKIIETLFTGETKDKFLEEFVNIELPENLLKIAEIL